LRPFIGLTSCSIPIPLIDPYCGSFYAFVELCHNAVAGKPNLEFIICYSSCDGFGGDRCLNDFCGNLDLDT
jgi:hypothetical protein